MKKAILIFFVIIAISTASVFAGYSYVNDGNQKYFIFDPGNFFVTNIKGSRSLLKTDIIIKMSDKKMFDYFTEHSYRIRDEIIGIFSVKTLDELREQNGQGTIKSELKDKLYKIYESEGSMEIYFNEFVIQ